MAEKIEHSYDANLVVTKTIITTNDDEFADKRLSRHSNQIASLVVKGKDLKEIFEKIEGVLSIEIKYANLALLAEESD